MENDIINHPAHYTNRQHECIDEMVAMFGKEAVIAFCKCNAWKYRYRAGSKGDENDAKADMLKSAWYVQKTMDLENELYYGNLFGTTAVPCSYTAYKTPQACKDYYEWASDRKDFEDSGGGAR